MLILNVGSKTALLNLRQKIPTSFSCVPPNPLRVFPSPQRYYRGNAAPLPQLLRFPEKQKSVSVFNFRRSLHVTTGSCISNNTMPPVVSGDDPKAAVTQLVKDNSVMVFSKSWCPFCKKLKKAFKLSRIDFEAVELDTLGTMGEDMQNVLQELTGQKTVPSVFINGNHIGGSDKTLELMSAGTLFATKNSEHDYDLVVIGGGRAA